MDEWEPLNNSEQVGDIVWFTYVKEHFHGICEEFIRKQQRYSNSQAFP